MNEATVSKTRACIEDAGGRAEVARKFDLTHWAVNKWYRTGRVPEHRVTRLTAMANRRLRRKKWRPAQLRPDLAAIFKR